MRIEYVNALMVKYKGCKYVNMYKAWLLLDPGKMDGRNSFSQIIDSRFYTTIV